MNKSVWFDNTEQQALEQTAHDEQASLSAIVRAAVRLFLGLPTARWQRELHDQLTSREGDR